jgi:hypothetical protein
VQLGRAHLFPATSVVETFEGQKANRGAAVPLASAHPSISGITLSDIAIYIYKHRDDWKFGATKSKRPLYHLKFISRMDMNINWC